MNLSTLLKVTTYVSVINGVVVSMSCRRDATVVFLCNDIPKDIPAGILEFRLEIENVGTLSLNSSTFADESWSRLRSMKITTKQQTDIVLRDNCFNALQDLRELYIHAWNPELFENTFFGLLNVETLDVSGCGHLTIDRLKLALSRLDILPRLHKIILSNWNLYKGSFAFDDDFVKILLPRNITFVDVSKSQLSMVDWNSIKNLKYIKVINASYTIISNFYDDKTTPNDFRYIQVLDISHATLPFKALPLLPGRVVISNITNNLSVWHRFNDFKKVIAVETLNVSGIVPHFNSIWLYNISVTLDVNPLMFVKNFIIRQNNLRRLDLRLVSDKFYFSSIESLDISDNGLEFLHSAFLFSVRNIIHLDMSKNQLSKMADENEIMFQNLISELKYLKIIRISENEFQNMPHNFFNGSRSIEEIDLSYNKLKQVTFILNHLDELKILNLKGNDIHVLNSDSIHHLNSVLKERNIEVSKASVYLQSNPISCSVCDAKTFLKWILRTNLIKKSAQRLKCIGENGKRYDINKNILKMIENVCKRKVIIISSCISAAFLLILVFVIVLVIYKRYKRQVKERNIAKVINNLRKGEGQFTFAVFLSYSSDDEDFVKANIQEQLNGNLQLMTGIDRQLVSTGDINFRPGFYLHDEVDRMIETASVIVVIVSNNFINSNYSCNEVNQACKSGKPVILMFIEHVEEREMEKIPVMIRLFKRNVRILWTVENGEPVLKTTWENVCRSILEVIE